MATAEASARVGRVVLALVTLVSVAGCALPQAPDGSRAPGAPGSTAPKSLTIAIQGEPQVLITNMGLGNQPNIGGDLQGALHQKLATLDDRGEFHPQLSTELPSQDKGTWLVRPDGTMQTTYKLRTGVTWHDGAPLSARDLVFAWTVTRDKELPISEGKIAPYINRIDTPDDFTLILEWSQTYPQANGIVEDDLGPLPAHLLEDIYHSDKEKFQHLPYWTREFVGVGPYRLADWVLGSQMVLKAYDAFYGGRAKIDTINVLFINDASTAVASLLSGAIDGAIPATLDFQRATFVRDQWEQAGTKPVMIVQAVQWRTMSFQFRPERANPRDLLDVRIRRGLLYGIDRKAIVDTLFNGQSPVSDVFMPPDDYRWDWIKDGILTYALDPRQAQTLLSDAGWRRDAGGPWLTSTGQPAVVAEWTTPDYITEVSIIADNWKGIGVDTEQVSLSPGQAQDREYVATFPAVMTTTFPINFQYWIQRHLGSACSTEANRWTGNNRGCYRNPEHDRIAEALNVTIDPTQQRQLFHDLAKIESEDLPALPLYFNTVPTIFREGVVGVKGNTKPKSTATWNVAEWDLR